jgi:hypothetical protein
MLDATAARFADNQAKVRPSPPKDEIELFGHIPLVGLPVSRLMSTQHFSSYYLYAEHDAAANVTLVDITKIRRSSVLADVAYSPEGNTENLLVGAGTASLVNSEPVAPAGVPQTLRITDFSDQHPKLPATSLGLPLSAEMIREDLFSSATAFRRTSGSRKDLYELYSLRHALT